MAINIYNYDSTLLTTVEDRTIDVSAASIKFPGKGYLPYGEAVNENMLWIMQNFAASTAPLNPVVGQAWYDTSSSILKVYTGSTWISTGGISNSATAPASPNQSDLWYDNVNSQLKQWSGSTWLLIGPLGSSTGLDPIYSPNVPLPAYNQIDSARISEGTVHHSVWRIIIGGILFAIISKDPSFSPNPAISGFSTINPGINFNTTIPGLPNYAPINSPNFTGVPTAPTPAAGTNTTQLATTAFVREALPDLTTYAPINSPILTGTPRAPTAGAGTNTTQIATTAFVQGSIPNLTPYALINSPNFTGVPTAPTPAAGTNNIQIATTAFVKNTVRERLTDNLQMYVSTTGNDDNTGRSPDQALASMQAAWDRIINTIDLNGYVVFVNVAAGTYNSGVSAYGWPVGAKNGAYSVQFIGTSSSNTTVDVAGSCFVSASSEFYFEKFKLIATGFGIGATDGGTIAFNDLDFGACGVGHIECNANGLVIPPDNNTCTYTISGGSIYHMQATSGGTIRLVNAAVTVTNTPTFSTAFAVADVNGSIYVSPNNIFTVTGTVTGTRWLTSKGGQIWTGTYDPNTVLPGSANGYSQGSQISANIGYWTDVDTGMMTMWGEAGPISAGSTATITLPTTFPNNIFGVLATPIGNTSAGQAVVAEKVSTSQIKLTNVSTSGSFNVYWEARGN